MIEITKEMVGQKVKLLECKHSSNVHHSVKKDESGVIVRVDSYDKSPFYNRLFFRSDRDGKEKAIVLDQDLFTVTSYRSNPIKILNTPLNEK